MRVSNKVWVVTGAGSGMGRELVLQLLGRGARVAAVDRNPDGLAEVSALAAAGERLSRHVVDITDRAAVRATTEGDSKVPMTSADKAARTILNGVEKNKLHVYVGMDAKFMNLAIKLAPKPAIRFVQKQMSKHLGAPQDSTR